MKEIKTAAGLIPVFTLLLAVFVGIFLIQDLWLQLFLLFVWLWLALIARLYTRERVKDRQVMVGLLYVFIASTFLNQEFLSLHAGFFTLFIYRLMMLACLVFFLGKIARNHGFAVSWQESTVKPYLVFFFAWAVYGALSLLWTPSVVEGLKYLSLLGMGLLFIFLVALNFREWSELKVFYFIWLVMSAILILIGLFNYVTGIQLPTSSLYGGPAYKLNYPTAVFTNQNDFATLLSISFFLYLAYASGRQSFAAKAFGYLGMILSALLIFLTDSRASEIGVVIGLAFYFFLKLRNKARKRLLIGLSVCFLAGIVLLFGTLTGSIAKYTTTETNYSINDLPASNVVRTHLLASSMHYLANTYGLGTGAGNLSYDLQTQPIYNTNHIYEAHNWLAEITATFGIFFGLGYLVIYLALFYCLYQYARPLPKDERGMFLKGVLPGQVAFLISSISPSSVSNLYFHWIFLGLIITLVSVLRSERSGQRLLLRGNG